MNILITGAAGGIGRATAELFLERGHVVHGLDVCPSDLDHISYTHHIADVRFPDSFPGGVVPEVLVNCAGIQTAADMSDASVPSPSVQASCAECGKSERRSERKAEQPQAFDDIEVNLKGTINVTEHYAIGNDKIKAVVNVGSASGHTGSEFPCYAAGKGGVLAYTKNAALRLAPRATCNSIDPGGVMTDLNKCVIEDEKLWARIMELTPMKRWAQPREIAEWIYFVGVTNSFMTGQNLLIDGGEAGNMDFVWK